MIFASQRYNKTMIGSHGYQYYQTPSFVRRKSAYIDQEFQVKYTAALTLIAFVGLSLVIGPTYYFLNQNYEIFINVAYNQAPELVSYLEREQMWINVLITGAFAIMMVFFGVLGFRITNKIIGPLTVLKNHMMNLSRGSWGSQLIKVRDDDEFQELIEVYNYFFSAFQVQLKKDLRNLKELKVNPENVDSYRIWKNMIEEKAMQLNLRQELIDPCPVILISEGVVPSHDSRHAS